MTKTLVKNEQEYRKFVFDILSKSDDSKIEEALGVIIEHNCWDYDVNGNPIDEDGKLIPDDKGSPESLVLTEEIKQLNYPIVVVSWIEKDWDRCGDITIIAVEFVSLKDFEA